MSVWQAVGDRCPPRLRPWWERLEQSDVARRLARGAFWSVAGTLTSRGLLLLSSVFVARLLGPQQYGELGLLRGTLGMFGVFAGIGLGITATKHVAALRGHDPQRAGRIVVLSGAAGLAASALAALALGLLAPWLAVDALGTPHLAPLLRVGCLFMLLSALNGIQTGALAGFEAFRSVARVNLAVGVLSFPLTVVGAWWGGLTGTVWGMTLGLGLHWLLNHLALRRAAARAGVPLAWKDCLREWPVLASFSLPAALSTLVVGPVEWLYGLLLVHRGGGYEAVSVYHAANQWYLALLGVAALWGSAVFPIQANLAGARRHREARRLMLAAVLVTATVIVPLVLLGSLLSPWVMGAYGPAFVAGWPTLVLVLLTAVAVTVQQPVGQIFAASGRIWLGLALNAGWAVVALVLAWLLADRGPAGVALARLVAYLLLGTATWALANKVLSSAGRREAA